ncbi:Oxidoreductase FAD/NAD(P)-binding protein [Cladophialophora carrionii]|uniref:nitric oxide dioxygenase n=1 Tax=Cladophialophora carrionii TaxID=86049 RepID=A0A1C1CT54_9EURO|nr:Oxidoreductase FAD/NAD(P)-binding protein [Cladophialophora carrionii]
MKREKGLNVEQDPDAMAHPGYVSNILHDQKKVGDIVQLSHPAGDFSFDVRTDDDDHSPTVLLSVGVGLTPLTSILNTSIAKPGRRQISWVHVSRNHKTHAFNDHVNTMAELHPWINKRVFHSNPVHGEEQGVHYDHRGRLDLSELDAEKDLKLSDKNATYYICGPEQFMVELEQALREKGVDANHINMELFGTGGVPQQSRDEGIETALTRLESIDYGIWNVRCVWVSNDESNYQ